MCRQSHVPLTEVVALLHRMSERIGVPSLGELAAEIECCGMPKEREPDDESD
jgi:hypothetical protein